jgi:hypothetical protein
MDEWRTTDERPTNDGIYLGYLPGEDDDRWLVLWEDGRWFDVDGGVRLYDRVTHWMPLPSRPTP